VNWAKFLRRSHVVLAAVWMLLTIPTVLWWHDSVLWVAFASLYANALTHVSSYMGGRAEKAANDNGNGVTHGGDR
jgi:preprotein translocase subunit SecG